MPIPFSGCQVWLGYIQSKGYGVVGVGRRTALAHRISWELASGPIPEGLMLDHLCRVRCCINPAHLEPVTGSINVLRGNGPAVTKARNQSIVNCPQGHLYSVENTYIDKTGARNCRMCHRILERTRRKAKKNAN